jgi:hypothetical protein
MMIKLPLMQIPEYWQHIKYGALAVNPQITKDAEVNGYCRNLLINLLSEKFQSWVIVEDAKVKAVAITRIYEDIGDIPHLLMEVIYGFSPVSDKEGALEGMKVFAKNTGCFSVNCYPGNPMAQAAARHAGFEKIAEIYHCKVGV